MPQDSVVVGMTNFNCPTCKGQKWLVFFDIETQPFDPETPFSQLSAPCRTCGASGIYVSRARAGLVCSTVEPERVAA